MAISEWRKQELLSCFGSMKPQLDMIRQAFNHNIEAHLDVGCYDGVLSLAIGAHLGARRIGLVDIEDRLEVELAPHARFFQADVCSPFFRRIFERRVNVVTCTSVLHECADPLAAALNLAGILPEGRGVLLLADRGEARWQQVALRYRASGTRDHVHYCKDLENIRRHKLEKDEDIQAFWEAKVFPRLPGRGVYVADQGVYNIVYQA